MKVIIKTKEVCELYLSQNKTFPKLSFKLTLNLMKNEENYIEAKISTNGKGMGFIKIPESKEEIVIESENINKALPNDIVRVIKIDGLSRDDRRLGKVISIVSRAREQFVGTVVTENNETLIKPDNFKIYTSFRLNKEDVSKVSENQKVLIKMTDWKDEIPNASLVKIFGQKGEHEVEIQSIIYEKGFIIDFPQKVNDEANELQKKWHKIPQSEINKRFDLRNEDIVIRKRDQKFIQKRANEKKRMRKDAKMKAKKGKKKKEHWDLNL